MYYQHAFDFEYLPLQASESDYLPSLHLHTIFNIHIKFHQNQMNGVIILTKYLDELNDRQMG